MLKMAFRNVFRQRRRSLLTALAMFGGFVLTALAIGLSDGTFNRIVDAFTRTRLGHVQVHARGYLDRPTLARTIGDPAAVGRAVGTSPDAEAWSPRVYSAGLFSVGERTSAARIVGLDPEREERTTGFARQVVRGRPLTGGDAKEIVLGAGLARSLGADLGAEVVVVTQGADGSLANEAYRLVGLAETGDLASDRSTAWLRLREAQDLLVLDGSVHEIVVVARSLKRVAALARDLRGRLAAAPLDVQPWQEFAKLFYDSMQTDQRGHRVMLLVLFVVVAIGVLNTALMSVLERRREYGVLKALGTRPRRLFSLIVLEVQVLALGSILAGAAVSAPLNAWLARHPLRLMSEPMTFGGMQWASAFASEVSLRGFAIPAFTVAVSAFLVSLLPALKAARTDPAKSIRQF